MNRELIKGKILNHKVLAVVRTESPKKLPEIIGALVDGGIIGIELTLTIPNVFDAIEKTAKEFGEKILLGVGSVTNQEDAIKAMDVGAEFVVSPVYKQEVVDATIKRDKVVIPAGFSPTEIQNVYEQGADFVKIFPADSLGMSFIRSIKTPLPHLNVIPTGGVTIENANKWIKNGASAIGIGSALVDNSAIASGNYERLTNKAKQLSRNLEIY